MKTCNPHEQSGRNQATQTKPRRWCRPTAWNLAGTDRPPQLPDVGSSKEHRCDHYEAHEGNKEVLEGITVPVFPCTEFLMKGRHTVSQPHTTTKSKNHIERWLKHLSDHFLRVPTKALLRKLGRIVTDERDKTSRSIRKQRGFGGDGLGVEPSRHLFRFLRNRLGTLADFENLSECFEIFEARWF